MTLLKSCISLSIVLTMLWALLVPMGVAIEHCHGDEWVVAGHTEEGEGHEHDAGHSHGESSEAGNPHGDDHHTGDHHVADHHAVHVDAVNQDRSGDPLNRFSFCCTDGTTGGKRDIIDVPTLRAPVSITPILVLSTFFGQSASYPTADQGGSASTSYKIGSSPPFHAIAGQHTYLRHSLLLI